MLSEGQRDRIGVVLVSPRNPLNIGAAARAMANFGFARLALVAPYAPHWSEARSAVGAPQVLQNARESATLAEAVAECTLVVGTGTLAHRKPEQTVVSLPDLGPLVALELARGGSVGVVFGPEKHGLTREDLSYCHLLVEIPTDCGQPSMNLGQAVAVCLYELAVHDGDPLRSRLGGNRAVTPAGDGFDGGYRAASAAERGSAPASGRLDLLAGLIEQTMVAAGYPPRSTQAANRHDLRLLLRGLALTERDVRRILGLFRRILRGLTLHREDGRAGAPAPGKGPTQLFS